MSLGIRDLMTVHREALLYIICGGFTTLVNWGSYAAFVWMGIPPAICNVLSWIVSVTFAFLTNKWFVFESRSLETKTLAEEITFFFGARIFTLVIASALFFFMYNIAGLEYGVSIFTYSLFGTEGMVTKIITSGIEIALNWIFSKYVVFRKDTSATE